MIFLLPYYLRSFSSNIWMGAATALVTWTFVKANKAKIDELDCRNNRDFINAAYVLPEAVILESRFDLTLRNTGIQTKWAKARFVAQKYNVRNKLLTIHDTATLRPLLIYLTLFATLNKSFRSFSHSFTESYLQSKQNLTRKVYTKVKKAYLDSFVMRSDTLLRH